MRADGALAGLKIVDLSRVLAGPSCTMILADHGAEVIKVEPPQGDDTRDWGPPFAGPDLDGAASYFLGVNRNKKSIALDLARPAGRDVLRRLLRDADVLVENFRPGTLERWGIGPDALAAAFPRLVLCRVTGFGADGPLGGQPGYDAVLQAMTGIMAINGDPASGPTRVGMAVVDIATGLYATIAILMALRERDRSGLGQAIDMTLHDCGLALAHPHASNWFFGGATPRPTGNPHPNLAPYETFAARDGGMMIAVGNDGQFRALCAVLGVETLAADPHFARNADRVRNRDALHAALQARLAEADRDGIVAALVGSGVPAGPVLGLDEAITAPHAAHRAMLAEHEGWRGIATPIKFSRTRGGAPARPPGFGEHTEEVLRAHGFSDDAIAGLRRDGTAPAARRLA